MSELAAHLERVLRRKLGASFSKVVDNETRMQIEQCLMPVVAAALAACAREARIAEVELLQLKWSNTWNDDLLGEMFEKRIAELKGDVE